MTVAFAFDNSFARLPAQMFTKVAATPVKAPRLRAWNAGLAREMGLPDMTADEKASIFSGNEAPDGSEPLAALYAGHQFGHWNPQLGDGRAILLGEVIGGGGARYDVQLKGAGPTPYSRSGDGRNWVGPALREYLVSEAMHALGVPTTRALALVTTGEIVVRDAPLPGAIVTRVARSHIRVGSFQVLAARGELETLEALVAHTIERHFPEATSPEDLLSAAVSAQASLIAHWLSLGFIHGVMNTDNAHVAGDTIDYGPCAFLDDYDPGKAFSSIDHAGRYAYANQPNIAAWNLAQLATALLPLIPDRDAAITRFTEIVNGFAPAYQAAWRARFGAKLGLGPLDDAGVELTTELLSMMADAKADFTNTFQTLSADALSDPRYADWYARWQHCAPDEDLMVRANPQVIPRNHLVEEVILAAVQDDWAPFDALYAAVTDPFAAPSNPAYTQPPEPHEIVHQTFCGT
ncbi:MAG: YdiU family protein [Pseudomonadota bacterium]